MDLITFGISGILTVGVSLISIILIILTIVFGIIRVIKKKFKKTFIILLIITILFLIIDFFAINNLIKNFNEIDIKNNDKSINIRQEDGKMILSNNPIEQLFMSDDKKIEVICNDIMNKIETEDYETITSIFSTDMINNVQNLDEGINKLIEISNENITDFKSQSNGLETHWDNGKHRNTYRFSIDITTNSANYSMGFEYDYENPFNNETLGVNRIVILDENKNILILLDNETINKGY